MYSLEKILNEKRHVEKLLNESFLSSNPLADMRVLIKHYVIQGKKKKEVITEVMNFLSNRIKKNKFDCEKWEKNVTSAFNRIIREKKKKVCKGKDFFLYEINDIHITQTELKKIRIINDEEQEKLAFVILVNSKINKLKYGNEMYGVSCNRKLYLEAELKFTHANKKLINELKGKGLIVPSKHHQSDYIEVLFVDESVNDNDLVLLDFRDYVLEYCRWRGDAIGVCSCRKPYRITSNAQIKCKECAHKDQLLWRREHMKKIRNLNVE